MGFTVTLTDLASIYQIFTNLKQIAIFFEAEGGLANGSLVVPPGTNLVALAKKENIFPICPFYRLKSEKILVGNSDFCHGNEKIFRRIEILSNFFQFSLISEA